MSQFQKGHAQLVFKDPTKWHDITCPCGKVVHCKIITGHGPRKYCSNPCKSKYRKQDWQRKPPSEETKRKIGLANRMFYAAHPEKLHSWKGGVSKLPGYKSSMKRRSRLGTEGHHTVKEWAELKEEYFYTCPSCLLAEPDIKLTQDHIIPLISGGSDWIDNIQPLCGLCNSKKMRKTIKYAKPTLTPATT